MSKLLNKWTPSESALDPLRSNGIEDKQIEESLAYLKDQSSLSGIADIDDYDNWNTIL
jgi:hypothetical protein